MKLHRFLCLLLSLTLLLCSCGKEEQTELSGGAASGSSLPITSVPDTGEVSPPEEPEPYELTFVFGGDFCLDESWSVMQHAATQPNGIFDCIDTRLQAAMTEADLCCLNNEFVFAARGEKLEGKLWHFRSDPQNVYLLNQLGVDLVTLANNHVYDYGPDAFADNLTILKAAGIDYVGAGMDLNEAASPVYYEMDGVTIAVVNATRAEKNVKTPVATSNSSGVMYCYDPAPFEAVIAQAKANADFVIACVHWGAEYSYELEREQAESARRYIDAGADVIVGSHSHCLQGIEYYKGKPIFYSLGNFWFNEKRLESCLLQLTLTGEPDEMPTLACKVIPAIQEDCVTRYAVSDEDRTAVFGLLNDISINAQVAPNGDVTETD